MGFLACVAACTVWAQMPVQVENPAESATAAEKTPALPLLISMEAELRHDLELHPEAAPTLYKLGLVLRQENKPKESLETYTRAAHLQKPNAEQLRSVALDYVLLNDYSEAIHWLQTALSFDPHDIDVLYSLARCFYTQSEFYKAEALYLQVLQIKPENLKAEENLGLTYDAENQPQKAEAALRTAVTWAAKQPSDEWPFLNLGTFLLDHDRAAEAIPFLQTAATTAVNSAICHEKLGRALEQSGKVTEGVKELEIAVRLDPKNPNIHFELGHAYRQAGALDKARVEFSVSQELRHERDRN
jgi:tetratricopeptide (TPR) repeat protein